MGALWIARWMIVARWTDSPVATLMHPNLNLNHPNINVLHPAYTLTSTFCTSDAPFCQPRAPFPHPPHSVPTSARGGRVCGALQGIRKPTKAGRDPYAYHTKTIRSPYPSNSARMRQLGHKIREARSSSGVSFGEKNAKPYEIEPEHPAKVWKSGRESESDSRPRPINLPSVFGITTLPGITSTNPTTQIAYLMSFSAKFACIAAFPGYTLH